MLNRFLVLTFALALPLLAPTGVSATAQRTFVASTGNDANSCSLAQPCRGFARAITQTNAGGEVVVLDSAGYGPVTITKSVSLIAPGGVYAGITVFSGDGITVDAPGAIVVLRGLSINGQGGSNGVNVLNAAQLRIEDCVVSGMGIDGIIYSARSLEMSVLDTIVRDNGASGIGGDADAFVVLDHVRSEHNGTNGFYMASLAVEARATITDSIFAFNTTNGIWFAATGTGRTYAQVERSVLADNSANGVKITSATSPGTLVRATVTRNAIHRNLQCGVAAAGPGNVETTVYENAILGFGVGICTDDINTYLVASANSILPGADVNFEQRTSSSFTSYSNNVGYPLVHGVIEKVLGF